MLAQCQALTEHPVRCDMSLRNTKIIISIVAVLLAVTHALCPSINIDSITVILLGFAVLPWLGPIFKSVELPGGVKVEYLDLDEAAKKVEKSGLIHQKKNLKPMQRPVYTFQAVAKDDPNLALSGLRIEIESRLRKLAENNASTSHRRGTKYLTDALEDLGVLSQDEAAAIRDLLPLLNKAAHGAEVDETAADWAIDFGPRVLGALEDRLGEITIPNLIDLWKHRDGAMEVEIGTQLSKAFITSPEAFLSSMNEHPRVFQGWLENLELHTFTIFDSASELDNELKLAYYIKLKELMTEAARSCSKTHFSHLASQVDDTIGDIEIQSIW